MITQFKKGIIELCVLKVVSKKDMYGFEVMEELSEPLQVNENTIYPLLRRLTSQELFTTYEKLAPNGARRKYYQITSLGKEALDRYFKEWHEFLDMTELILGGKNNG